MKRKPRYFIVGVEGLDMSGNISKSSLIISCANGKFFNRDEMDFKIKKEKNLKSFCYTFIHEITEEDFKSYDAPYNPEHQMD